MLKNIRTIKCVFSLLVTGVFLMSCSIPALASDSFTSKSKTASFIYNETGLPFSLQAVCYVGVDGCFYGNTLQIDVYKVSGAIVNADNYPISMAMQHSNSKIYSGSTNKATYYNNNLAYFNIVIPSGWQAWDDYGEKNPCNLFLNTSDTCKSVVSTWWHSNDTLPTDWQPTYTHNFWVNCTWVN